MEKMVPGRAASWPGGPAWASPRVCGEYPPTGSPAQQGHRAHVKWFSSAGVSEKNKEKVVCLLFGALSIVSDKNPIQISSVTKGVG